jgi:hypothetical protein
MMLAFDKGVVMDALAIVGGTNVTFHDGLLYRSSFTTRSVFLLGFHAENALE